MLIFYLILGQKKRKERTYKAFAKISKKLFFSIRPFQEGKKYL